MIHPILSVDIRSETNSGPGIADPAEPLAGRRSGTGTVSASRLKDEFEIQTVPGRGTTMLLGRRFPRRIAFSARDLARITQELAAREPQDLFEKIRQQSMGA